MSWKIRDNDDVLLTIQYGFVSSLISLLVGATAYLLLTYNKADVENKLTQKYEKEGLTADQIKDRFHALDVQSLEKVKAERQQLIERRQKQVEVLNTQLEKIDSMPKTTSVNFNKGSQGHAPFKIQDASVPNKCAPFSLQRTMV